MDEKVPDQGETSVLINGDRINSRKKRKKSLLFSLGFGLIASIVAVLLYIYLFSKHSETSEEHYSCGPNASYMIYETIPQNLTYSHSTHLQSGKMYEGWLDLINSTKETLDIACFYMTLTHIDDSTPVPSGHINQAGPEVYDALKAAAQRGVKIRIAQNLPSKGNPGTDTANLSKLPNVEVRTLNFTQLQLGGILHTKFIISDYSRFYVGSANMDWRSLAQVKELGIIVKDCELLSHDLKKIFEMYFEMGVLTSLPKHWPTSMDTKYGVSSPANVSFQGSASTAYLTSSPQQLAPPGRTNDIDGLIAVIQSAKHSVCISVMDYYPGFMYDDPPIYWGIIDNALRAAAMSETVEVRMLISHWNHSNADMFQWLRSLDAANNISVRIFEVPDNVTPSVPFTRVNHAKYMVTDAHAFIGTSNWSPDYFEETGGVSFISPQPALRQQLQDIFDRDWFSTFATPIHNTPY
eukprot:GCRY01001328.1.p1 GENE.GCRY01001328.1~~GCRY01001328.1.p1  ORF type:complete len:465 (+),score=29.97 GCRY01001328.1:119-1513(+)